MFATAFDTAIESTFEASTNDSGASIETSADEATIIGVETIDANVGEATTVGGVATMDANSVGVAKFDVDSETAANRGVAMLAKDDDGAMGGGGHAADAAAALFCDPTTIFRMRSRKASCRLQRSVSHSRLSRDRSRSRLYRSR